MARCRASSKTSGSALKKTAFAREQDRPDAARYRKRWQARQVSADPRRLVFLDETWVKTNMAPLRGWGARGRRLIGKAPHGRWRTLTFLDAPCGWTGSRRPASLTDRLTASASAPMPNSSLSAPSSLAISSCSIIPAVTKARRSAKPSRTAGAHRFFLPPYSPDLNPIVQVFAKLKLWLRQARTRSIPDLHDAIADILQQVSARECAAYFRNSGYASK